MKSRMANAVGFVHDEKRNRLKIRQHLSSSAPHSDVWKHALGYAYEERSPFSIFFEEAARSLLIHSQSRYSVGRK